MKKYLKSLLIMVIFMPFITNGKKINFKMYDSGGSRIDLYEDVYATVMVDISLLELQY